MVVVKAHFVLATQSVITRLTRVIACSMGSHNIYKGSVRSNFAMCAISPKNLLSNFQNMKYKEEL